MKFFESSDAKIHEVVIVLSHEEGKILIEAVEAAVEANKKKTTWKRLLANLSEKLAVF